MEGGAVVILPAIGEQCSCGHIWTEEQVKLIWKRSPPSDQRETIVAVLRAWYEGIIQDSPRDPTVEAEDLRLKFEAMELAV